MRLFEARVAGVAAVLLPGVAVAPGPRVAAAGVAAAGRAGGGSHADAGEGGVTADDWLLGALPSHAKWSFPNFSK